MADKIVGYTQDGLVLLTYNEIVEKLTQAFEDLLGSDIDLSSNTPDGQLLRIFAEMIADTHDTMRELDNSFNPDVCRGAAQDYRYRLNNIERKAGSYTSIPITFTVKNKEQTLSGLDGQEPDVGTAWGVTDDSNNYLLNSTETFQTGTYTRQFTCTKMDDVNPPIGSITKQITSVNNVNITDITNQAATVIGSSVGTDEQFAARREQSFVNSGLNCCDSITSELLKLSTIVNAKAYEHDYENYPDSTDADGIPINTIWVVVDGGSATEIAKVIYANISGTNTKGAQSGVVTSVSGQDLTFNFDYVQIQQIYVKFKLQKLYSSFTVRDDDLKQEIADRTLVDINASLNSSEMNQIIRDAISANTETVQLGAVPLEIKLSTDNSQWSEYLPNAGKQKKYTLIPTNVSFEVVEP